MMTDDEGYRLKMKVLALEKRNVLMVDRVSALEITVGRLIQKVGLEPLLAPENECEAKP